jgi:succinoglycan biosynthesis protein ExoO
MHDLFSIRALQFERLGQSDSVTQLDITTEMGLLGQADAVIAIQQQEADVVASYLTPGRVITAPMAADCVNEPSVGEDDRLLFVGSKAAPNVDAMHWFLSEVWPQIILLRPNACFDIVGNVCSALVDIPAAATLHGLVDDLTPFYRRAGVVVSPLRAGSGLKIKLIEALGFGKACVVTSATCLGVEQMILGAVKISDTADSMARDVAALLADRKDRSQLAAAALNIARATFGREKTYSSIVEFYKTRVK